MKQIQSGRSMVEMLAVLALTGVISLAGITGYSQTISKTRANQLAKDALSRATAVNSLSSSYFVRRIATNATITLPGFDSTIGGSSATQTKASDTEFILSYGNVSRSVCQKLIETTAIGLYQTTVNGTPMSVDNASALCSADANTVAFYFYRAGYASNTFETSDAEEPQPPETDACAEIRCNGCQVCSNGACVNDDSKCTGCQKCDVYCVDDNTKCDVGICRDGDCIE